MSAVLPDPLGLAGQPWAPMDAARAHTLAERLHRGQRDAGGGGLIEHVRRVAATVAPDARVVAWLYETLEHTSISGQSVLAGTSVDARAARDPPLDRRQARAFEHERPGPHRDALPSQRRGRRPRARRSARRPGRPEAPPDSPGQRLVAAPRARGSGPRAGRLAPAARSVSRHGPLTRPGGGLLGSENLCGTTALPAGRPAGPR